MMVPLNSIIAITALLFVLEIRSDFVSSSSSTNNNVSPNTLPQGLSMDEFDTILITDIYVEFGTTTATTTNASSTNNNNDANELWNAASLFEWEQALQMESSYYGFTQRSYYQDTSNLQSTDTTNNQDPPSIYLSTSRRRLHHLSSSSSSTTNDPTKHPYIICDPDPKSGHLIRIDIQSFVGTSTDLVPIYNRDDMSCFYAYLQPSIAQTANVTWKIQPLLPEMKIGAGTFSAIMDATSDDDLPEKFEALLCPGVSGTSNATMEIAEEILENMREGSGNGTMSFVTERFLRVRRRLTTDHHPKQQLPKKFDRNDDPSSYLLPSHNNRTLQWQSALRTGLDSPDHPCNEMFTQIVITPKNDSFVIAFSNDGEEDIVSSSVPKSCLVSLVAGLAVQTNVCSVGIRLKTLGLNREAQWIIQSKEQDRRPFFEGGLSGKGQVVAVSDTGIDVRNCYFRDDWRGSVKKDGSIDKSKRKVIQYYPFADKFDDTEGHGTHVAGTVAGRRSTTIGRADGIARDAKIAFFDIGFRGQKGLSIPSDVDVILDPGRDAGALIHSASWGSQTNAYGFSEKSFDEYLYEDDDMLVVLAAGNSGTDDYGNYDIMESVASPAVSKNVISVGACQSEGPDIDVGMLGMEYLADFSSRGPSADGRTVPDVVAPGYWILSASAQPGYGNACDDTDGIVYKRGTSMATPVVAGAAAIIRQYFEEGWHPTGEPRDTDKFSPSGTLIKAVLMNGAQYLKGIQNGYRVTNVAPYDNHQNFGRVSLLDSVPLRNQNDIRSVVLDRQMIYDGEVHTIGISIDTTSSGCTSDEISATLVWADPPAVPNCRQCVLNDLDLYLSREGYPHRIYPNGLKRRDDTNNAERVRTKAFQGENYAVSVEAHDLETEFQTYALVVTGCVVRSNTHPPIPSPTPSPDSSATAIRTNKLTLALTSFWMMITLIRF